MNYIQIASTGEDNHNRDVQAEVVEDALAVGFFKGAAPWQPNRLLEVSSCLAQGFWDTVFEVPKNFGDTRCFF